MGLMREPWPILLFALPRAARGSAWLLLALDLAIPAAEHGLDLRLDLVGIGIGTCSATVV
jgi:hypothetical protein